MQDNDSRSPEMLSNVRKSQAQPSSSAVSKVSPVPPRRRDQSCNSSREETQKNMQMNYSQPQAGQKRTHKKAQIFKRKASPIESQHLSHSQPPQHESPLNLKKQATAPRMQPAPFDQQRQSSRSPQRPSSMTAAVIPSEPVYRKAPASKDPALQTKVYQDVTVKVS